LWPRFAADVFDVAIVGQLRRDLRSMPVLHSSARRHSDVTCSRCATA
jgi:hypothetical protein